MENQKKIEFYKYLKKLFPNLKDTTLMLIVEDSIELINKENGKIDFPLDILELPTQNVMNREYDWKVIVNNYGRL